MVHLLQLHSLARNINERNVILVNPDNISYISSIKDGGSHIHFCCALKDGYSQGISVVENLDEILYLKKKL